MNDDSERLISERTVDLPYGPGATARALHQAILAVLAHRGNAILTLCKKLVDGHETYHIDVKKD